jgi:Glycosyltransferase family 9 (heptosyltransferase)
MSWVVSSESSVESTAELIEECRRRFTAVDVDVSTHLDAVEREARSPLPLYSLARLCRRRGHLELWHSALSLALPMPHDTCEELFARGTAKLTLGDWSGWLDRETRQFHPEAHEHSSVISRTLQWRNRPWSGAEEVEGETVLVLGDGGFGDCIQMLRFVRHVTTIAGGVILAVRPELFDLVAFNFGQSTTVVPFDASPSCSFEYYISINSLPARCEALPTFVPLLTSRPATQPPNGTLRVGFCWAGNPGYVMNGRRSIPLELMAPVLGHSHIQWYNLQVGREAPEAERFPNVAPAPLPLDSFAATADVIAGLDAVVSVDTAVAHLAASLGIPTFLLLHYVSEFRWGLDNRTSWYPAMRLVRQPTPGDWVGAVGELDSLLHDPAFITSLRCVRSR